MFQSENEELQKGDVIKKIDDYDGRDVRHVDAQNLLQNSESVKLVVERSEPINDSTMRNYISNNKTEQSSIVESINASEWTPLKHLSDLINYHNLISLIAQLLFELI